jgi:hypothetical protein
MKACNCYVSKLPAHDQMVIRYGAHDQSCPKYKKSLDPVDQIKDRRLWNAHHDRRFNR